MKILFTFLLQLIYYLARPSIFFNPGFQFGKNLFTGAWLNAQGLRRISSSEYN